MTSVRDLTARLADLLRRERSALAEFLVALAGFDRERRWVELGHPSLFSFLHRELGLSKSAAFYRATAATLVQEYPEVVEPLREGRLCLSTVGELSKVITPQNRAEVLPRFFHLSKREAMAVAAELRPCETAPQRTVVTAVRAPTVAPALALPVPRPGLLVLPEEPLQVKAAPAAPRSPPRPLPAEVVPLTAELNRMHLTVSRRFLEKLAAARAALSHSHPGATEEQILAAGLDLLLERHAKRRGLVEKPRPEPKPSEGGSQVPAGAKRWSKRDGYIPAHVRRAVWLRDGGRCSWKLQGGGVCGSTHQLEYDHIRPKALGGTSTVDNVRLGCRFHNDLAARKVYGDALMDRYTRGPGSPAPGYADPPP